MQALRFSRFSFLLCQPRKISSIYSIEAFGKSMRYERLQHPFTGLSSRQYFISCGQQLDSKKVFISGVKYNPSGLKNSVHDKFQWTCFYSVLPNHKVSFSNNSKNDAEKTESSNEKSSENENEVNDSKQDTAEKSDVPKSKDGMEDDTLTNYVTQESSVLEERKVVAELEGTIVDDNVSILQRFKAAYKEHGKTLIAVHCVTSVVWFGSFYYAAHSGFDVHSLLERIGLPDKIITPLSNSELGNVALAYIMYKIATPARYTVTLWGTRSAIKYLKKIGKIKAVPEGDSIRDLFSDSRDVFSQKVEERKEEWAQIVEETKEQLKGQSSDDKESSDKKQEKPSDKK